MAAGGVSCFLLLGLLQKEPQEKKAGSTGQSDKQFLPEVLPLPQLGGKLHLLAHHAGADAAFVGFGDAPGDGQPDAKAAGGSIAGGVGAVKAVEQLCKRVLRDGVAAAAFPCTPAFPVRRGSAASPGYRNKGCR